MRKVKAKKDPYQQYVDIMVGNEEEKSKDNVQDIILKFVNDSIDQV